MQEGESGGRHGVPALEMRQQRTPHQQPLFARQDGRIPPPSVPQSSVTNQRSSGYNNSKQKQPTGGVRLQELLVGQGRGAGLRHHLQR